MDCRITTHRLLPGGALALLAALAVALDAAPARADSADQVTITGTDLAEPLEIPAEDYPDLCAALNQEVNWLVGKKGGAPEPADMDALGPQYTLVLHIEREPTHRFHLYPLAEGGPRVFRPAEQPGDETAKEAWFFGRLSLPHTLAAAGVPLTGEPVPAGGGTGGQLPELVEETEAPDRSAFEVLHEWRESVLLTGAVVVAIVAGLGGIAFLIRRKV